MVTPMRGLQRGQLGFVLPALQLFGGAGRRLPVIVLVHALPSFSHARSLNAGA
jgi:hypothetical protein